MKCGSMSRLSITRERYVALDNALWHGPSEEAIPVDVFSFGMDRICVDIESLTMDGEQRRPPPQRIAKPRKQEGRSTRVDPALDAQFRKLLGMV